MELYKKMKEFTEICPIPINIGTYLSREMKHPDEKKSTHCGLTKNEMEVPLIVFDLKD